ncbi:MAG: domain containing protein [Bacteriovoracaceae bacterium]|nr:domain containing protein [Bacteriovoracaceae bacterium]
MFYVLSVNRVLEPYQPKRVVEKAGAASEAHEVHDRDPSQGQKNLAEQKLANKAYEEQLQVAIPQHPLTVEQIMSRPVVTIHESASVKDLKEIMVNSGFRNFPVVSGNLLVGMISDRDLVSATTDQISKLFAQKVFAVDPRASIRNAVSVMLQEKLSCLPVVDSNRVVVGIVTTTDILKTILTHTSFETWR